MALITVTQAIDQLHIPGDLSGRREEVLFMMELATAIVLDWLRNPDHGWVAPDAGGSPDETVPILVQGSILRMLAHLNRWRGDDLESRVAGLANGNLPDDVTSLIYRLRDPALA